VPTRYPNTMPKHAISIIGAGRVGRALGRRLHERGWKIHAIVTRTEAAARRAVRSIGGGCPYTEISQTVFSAPVILICVPESAIPGVATRLASFGEDELRKKIVLHTSGALSSGILAELRSLGAEIGSIHPLQTFSGIGVPDLEGKVFAIEGDFAALRVARGIARTLGGQPVQLGATTKPLYHAAAVLAAGHLLALQETAVQMFAGLGMKRREALKALLSLARQTLDNLERLGPRAAWTGPLARGDYAVIALHEDALHASPVEYLHAYRALNSLAARVLARDSDSTLRELARISAKNGSGSQSKVRGAST
jgi:predicted short-subunit dehydrogenase-like oxidoreductase (DUF2520 family)